jgi:hypothetical protein
MVFHIEKFTPPHYLVLGEDGTREVVNLGIKQAKQYGFTNRGPVQFYIEMMFMIGSYFDTDPQYSWAAQILNDETIPDQMQRADKLFYKMQEYLKEVAGPKNEYAMRAFQSLSAARDQSVPTMGPNFREEMIRRLDSIYPEKSRYVGEPALSRLVDHATENSEANGMGMDPGPALFSALEFALGYGFTVDPQFPWVINTINNPAISEPNKRIERLKSKSLTYLDNVLEYFQKG